MKVPHHRGASDCYGAVDAQCIVDNTGNSAPQDVVIDECITCISSKETQQIGLFQEVMMRFNSDRGFVQELISMMNDPFRMIAVRIAESSGGKMQSDNRFFVALLNGGDEVLQALSVSAKSKTTDCR